jgi:nucleotide-binding universal stress UspA family protein
MRITRIVVPLDFGEPADRALPVAQALGDRIGARLCAVVVTSPGLAEQNDQDEARWHARRSGCRLDEVVLRTDDDVVGGILAAASPPNTLLCLAAGARPAAVSLVATSLSEQVVTRSDRPVLAVGPAVLLDGSRPIDHLLCCVDDEPALTDRLLDVTAAWARTLDCTPHLVRVVPPAGDRTGSVFEARESLDAVVRSLWARGAPATSGLVADDDVSGAIVRCAARRRNSLVVVASHGRSGLRRLALGSITLDVLRRSPAPLLVVPGGMVRSDGATALAGTWARHQRAHRVTHAGQR